MIYLLPLFAFEFRYWLKKIKNVIYSTFKSETQRKMSEKLNFGSEDLKKNVQKSLNLMCEKPQGKIVNTSFKRFLHLCDNYILQGSTLLFFLFYFYSLVCETLLLFCCFIVCCLRTMKQLFYCWYLFFIICFYVLSLMFSTLLQVSNLKFNHDFYVTRLHWWLWYWVKKKKKLNVTLEPVCL